MKPACESLSQGFVHEAMALDTALAEKGVRYDIKSEMRLASLAPAGVAVVLLRLVRHHEVSRPQSLLQAIRDLFGQGHRLNLF